MADSLKLLDEALELGRKELETLSAGDVDATHDLARRRGELVVEAWKRNKGVDVDLLLNRLRQLKSMQGQLTAEAKQLHETLKQDLARAKQENKRLEGYHGALKRTSGHTNRYISKQG